MHWPWQMKKETWERERELYHRLCDVGFVLDTEGKIVGIIKSNPKRHPIPEDIKGKYLRTLLGPEHGLKGAQAMREAISMQRGSFYEYSVKQGDANYFYRAEIIPLPRTHRGREDRVLWLAHDCTEKRQEESSLWMRNELLEGILNAKISLVSGEFEGTEALTESLKVIGSATRAERVYILEHYQTPYYQVLSLQREWCAPGVQSQLQNARLEQIEYEDLFPGWLGGLLKSGYRYFSLDELPEKFRDVLRVADDQWIVMLPIFKEKLLWGVLALEFHKQHREWTHEEIGILKAMSGTIGSWVSEQETRKELSLAKIEAEKANKAKSEFLAVISHELRTPMNAILGYSQILKQTVTHPEHREQAGFIERSGRALLELINNILDFSKIESKGIELEVISFSMEQVVMETLETCTIRAKEKGLSLDYTLDKDLPKQLLGDPFRIKQVLINLVNNAVKFTQKGGVHVSVVQKPVDAKVILHCSIKDTGIGIDPSKTSRLFKAFSQVDSSTTRQYGGTGLGLAIALRLVEKMGGKIWVESVVGEGSVFHFTIQVTRLPDIVGSGNTNKFTKTETEAQTSIINEKELVNGDLDPTFGQRFPLRILLVEDDPMNQRLAMKLLDRLGYMRVDVAFDGIEGLKRINEGDYELVLTDLQMPRLDGIGLTQRLRMGECGAKKKRLPVVAITAYAIGDDRERCIAAGMTDFIRKPIQISELKSAIITAYHQRIAK